MLQILNWLCLISVSFLSFQVFSYMCKDAIKLYKSIIKTKKVYSKKTVIPTITDELLKKVAKWFKKVLTDLFSGGIVLLVLERGREIRNLAEK